jgi:hypothetical protein
MQIHNHAEHMGNVIKWISLNIAVDIVAVDNIRNTSLYCCDECFNPNPS